MNSQNCNAEIKHDYIWLTIPNCSHLDEIRFKLDKASETNLKNEIWFEDTPENRTKVEIYLKKIKMSIYSSYPDKDKPKWLTMDWVNAPINWNK